MGKGTRTNYNVLIELLENRITIRDAFLMVTEEKAVIEYNGGDVTYNIVKSGDIQNNLLPTAGEYMDAEDDEYAEEIAAFRLRNENLEYKIRPQINSLVIFDYRRKRITLTDDYFSMDLDISDGMKFSFGKIHEQKIALA